MDSNIISVADKRGPNLPVFYQIFIPVSYTKSLEIVEG